jgi:hypothetical protein
VSKFSDYNRLEGVALKDYFICSNKDKKA